MKLLALFVSTAFARNYFVDMGIQNAASQLGQYHASGVNSADASAMASELLGSYIDAPPISTAIAGMVSFAERQAVMNFGRQATVDVSAAESLLADYSTAFSSFSHGTDWAPFAAKVRKHHSSYDVSKMLAAMKSDSQQMTATQFDNFKQQFDQFKTQSEGKRVMATLKQLYDAHNQGLQLGLPAFANLFNLI